MTNDARKKPPLLIVDDDRAVRRLLARVAERAGFDVDTAKDGVQALEMLQNKHYDIAIVDLMMPRLSGYELVQKISAITPRPVVIVATALMNGDVASLDDSMVRRVIKKPFDINAVANALIETAKDIAEKRTPTALPPATIVATDANIVTDVLNLVKKDETSETPTEEKPPAAEENPPKVPPPEKIE